MGTALAGALLEQSDQSGAQQQRGASDQPISREVVKEQAERTGSEVFVVAEFPEFTAQIPLLIH